MAAKLYRWISSMPAIQDDFGQYIIDLDKELKENIHINFDDVHEILRPMLD